MDDRWLDGIMLATILDFIFWGFGVLGFWGFGGSQLWKQYTSTD
jgi:hypothetical protein